MTTHAFGLRLREFAREHLGANSDRDIAELLNVSIYAVRSWAQGKRSMHPSTMALAHALAEKHRRKEAARTAAARKRADTQPPVEGDADGQSQC